MRIYTPASSGEGANLSQITSGPDGNVIKFSSDLCFCLVMLSSFLPLIKRLA